MTVAKHRATLLSPQAGESFSCSESSISAQLALSWLMGFGFELCLTASWSWSAARLPSSVMGGHIALRRRCLICDVVTDKFFCGLDHVSDQLLHI